MAPVKFGHPLGDLHRPGETGADRDDFIDAVAGADLLELLFLALNDGVLVLQAVPEVIQGGDIPHVVENILDLPVLPKDGGGGGQNGQVGALVVADAGGLLPGLDDFHNHRVGKNVFVQKLLGALPDEGLFPQAKQRGVG